MAEFISAFVKCKRSEGGYSNHPNDPGGETYMGISRVHWPQWSGWGLLDEAKKGNFPYNIGYYTQLPQLVRFFYKVNFWDKMGLDLIDNQDIADKLFDTAVNVNIGKAVSFLQRALNAANRRGALWQDVKIDGILGPATVGAILGCEKAKRVDGVLAGMKVLQGAYYFTLMEKNEKLEEFYLGWLTRAMSQ